MFIVVYSHPVHTVSPYQCVITVEYTESGGTHPPLVPTTTAAHLPVLRQLFFLYYLYLYFSTTCG